MLHHAAAPVRTSRLNPRRASCVRDGSEHLVKRTSTSLGLGRAAAPRSTSWTFALWSSTSLGSPWWDGSSRGHCWSHSNGLPACKRSDDRADPAHTHRPHGPATPGNPWLRLWRAAPRDATHLLGFPAPAPPDDAAAAHVLHAAPGPDAAATETRDAAQQAESS